MSWDVSVVDKEGKTIETNHSREEGGTYQLGGTNKATLNVTYNYRKHFDFRQLHGMSINHAHLVLCSTIQTLSDEIDDDYWKSTEGNVKKTLTTLAEFAEYAMMNKPECTFEVN